MSCALECLNLAKSLIVQSVLQLTGLILSCDSDVTRLIAVDWAVRLVVKPRMWPANHSCQRKHKTYNANCCYWALMQIPG